MQLPSWRIHLLVVVQRPNEYVTAIMLIIKVFPRFPFTSGTKISQITEGNLFNNYLFEELFSLRKNSGIF
ncbi:hypothetical protein SAMN05216323_103320 [Williamwhitmania taraxaci]|uniref:Uncharacterized protein n=1 Tax=Williamwhitmania taraxaci TaxID=1640674 RepID=A0A1G6LXD3_9BACT|nr:hypothetical protein SAMN05216323_103320 [Williamwhitmania taraxaci]